MGPTLRKPCKIQQMNGVGRVGITATDLKDLKNQAVKRFEDITEDFEPHLDDGTAVLTEKYFKSLPEQTCFTFYAPREGNLKMDFLQLQLLTQRISKRLSEQQNNLLEGVRRFLSGDNSEIINRALLDYISSLESNIHLESREEDSGWFDGLHQKYQTKEAVMKDGAKTRIKNYYQKTREYMLEQDSGEGGRSVLDSLREELNSNHYNGEYFVRSDKTFRICDELGWFRCEGKFDEEICGESHSINPYGSKEARIVFSTWNLDHVIEKSREILPTLVEVTKKCPKNSEVNWPYFYDLLFTKENLKLVHVACHVKGIHANKKCDRKQFYKAKRKGKLPSRVAKESISKTRRSLRSRGRNIK